MSTRAPRQRRPQRGGATPIEAPAGAPAQEPAPQLPHERDQSTGQTGDTSSDVIEQARRDLEAGQVDTDLHATPGLDAQRRRELLRRGR